VTLCLDHAIVYDVETFPNAFTFNAQGLFTDLDIIFEISHFRDDRHALLAWLEYWREHEVPMVGFNNVFFDYPVLHFIWTNPDCTVEDIYAHAMAIISNHSDRFGYTIWQSDRLCPQVDVYLIHHMNNRARATSLKALQVAMRSESVMESAVPFGTVLTREQIDNDIIPYNRHDTAETKKFALISLDAIKFRIGLMDSLHGDVLNANDGKIGMMIFRQRLGDELCFTRESGTKEPRKTYRTAIRLNDIIFPYIRFSHPEFNRVLSWMRDQVLTPDELSESEAIRAKGVFKNITATVGGLDFHFGTGGIHGSVSAQMFAADVNYVIKDIDVTGMYPAIAIKNRLYPEHLGPRFVDVYDEIVEERGKYAKGTKENAMLKLAGNVPYGNSNSEHSFMYDPAYTMSTTINGQLMLCMLAEWLFQVPTLQILQINTDGISYRVHRDVVPYAEVVRRMWERVTRLNLEEAEYSRMWIRDVNNYVGETTAGKLKKKGAYWFPDKFPDDLSGWWHKDYSAQVVIKAAVAHMTTGVDIERFVTGHGDPFDFMLRAKCDRASRLMIGEREVQRITRYYMAHNGEPMRKVSPPVAGAVVGTWKKARGVSDAEYAAVMAANGSTWNPAVHTKNKSKYEIREMAIESGHKVAECNRAADFDFERLNYDWYIAAARKLVIA
jgi:hypothetical protein